MANVKKLRPVPNYLDSSILIPEDEAICALRICWQIYNLSINTLPLIPLERIEEYVDGSRSLSPSTIGWHDLQLQINDFVERFNHQWYETTQEIWRWDDSIKPKSKHTPEDAYRNYVELVKKTKAIRDIGPQKTSKNLWEFKGFVYEVNGFYTDEEAKLLILEDFDKERQRFEKLRLKFQNTSQSEASTARSRIPENVRVEVWRRDSGKCARCGDRTNLEYDHIVPISKGGSNTVRNIELLCEKCNRSKSDNVV